MVVIPHRIEKTDKKTYYCHKCEEKFEIICPTSLERNTLNDVFDHELTYLGNNKYQCSGCKFSFRVRCPIELENKSRLRDREASNLDDS